MTVAEQNEIIRAMWNDGNTYAEIGAKLNLPRWTVTKRGARMALEPHGKGVKADWLYDEVLFRKLCEDGVPYQQIADKFKTSRNAVIGKARRMGVTKRPNPSLASNNKRRRVKRDMGAFGELIPVARAKAAYKPVVVASGCVSKCAFIHGDVRVGGWRYCDAPTVPGKSYCGFHFSICTVVVRDRREDAA